MRRMAGDRLWYWGFRAFYHLKHPRYAPLVFLRRIARRLVWAYRASPAMPKPLPKKIWIYWEQGWNAAPPLVKRCRESWVRHNPGWDIAFLDAENLSTYVDMPSFEGKEITRTGYSNIVRLKLLSKRGGVWVDATTFCTASLDAWLPHLMQSGFFAFHKPKTTVASWFIAAAPDNALIRCWERSAARFWSFTRKPDVYFWVQYLFEYLIWRDASMRRIWEDTPHVNTDGPYAAQRYLKRADRSAAGFADLISHSPCPVHKLSWKIDMRGEFLDALPSSSE